MQTSCLVWVPHSRHRLHRHLQEECLQEVQLLPQQTVGNVRIAIKQFREDSVRNAVRLNPKRKRDGSVPAVIRSIRVSSVRSAEQRSLRAHRFISVTSAAGSRRIRCIRRSSVLSAAILLTRMTFRSDRLYLLPELICAIITWCR